MYRRAGPGSISACADLRRRCREARAPTPSGGVRRPATRMPSGRDLLVDPLQVRGAVRVDRPRARRGTCRGRRSAAAYRQVDRIAPRRRTAASASLTAPRPHHDARAARRRVERQHERRSHGRRACRRFRARAYARRSRVVIACTCCASLVEEGRDSGVRRRSAGQPSSSRSARSCSSAGTCATTRRADRAPCGRDPVRRVRSPEPGGACSRLHRATRATRRSPGCGRDGPDAARLAGVTDAAGVWRHRSHCGASPSPSAAAPTVAAMTARTDAAARARPPPPLAPVHPAARLAGRGRAGHRARRGLHAVGHRRQRRYIDGVSSLWCNVHGHAPPAHRRRRPRAARPRRAHDDARPQPPAGDRARASAWSSSRPTGSAASSSPTTARRPTRSR